MDAILLIDHGSRKGNANALIDRIAGALRQQLPEQHVETAHMEFASPTIAEGFDACVAAGASRIVVQPYFLAAGLHTTETIPQLVREAASRHPDIDVRIAAPLGFDQNLVDLVQKRVENATTRDPLR